MHFPRVLYAMNQSVGQIEVQNHGQQAGAKVGVDKQLWIIRVEGH